MKRRIVSVAWLVSAFVALLGYGAWYQSLSVPYSQLTIYDVFTLFGVTAFGLMWAHYAVGALRTYLAVDKEVLKNYFRLTSYGVLICLLLHPGLLVWQLQRDQAGLPLDYVAPDERLFLILGMIAWLAFMLYETRRFFADRAWWPRVVMAGDVAMVLVFIHGFMLSSQLMPSWFRVVWALYGISLLGFIVYGRKRRWKTAA